jgi:hypothetical protein
MPSTIDSLGKVTVAAAGTPVRITNNEVDPVKSVRAHSFLIQVLPTNTGKIYIGKASMNKVTLAGVFVVLGLPSSVAIPSFSATLSYAPAAFELIKIFIDADVDDDGALVTFVQG